MCRSAYRAISRAIILLKGASAGGIEPQALAPAVGSCSATGVLFWIALDIGRPDGVGKRPPHRLPPSFNAHWTNRHSHNMGQSRLMKTTLEIPDELFRRAKSAAAEQGIPLRELVSALAEELRARGCQDKPWLKTFGKLRGLRKETARINRIIEDEFGRIERAFRLTYCFPVTLH